MKKPIVYGSSLMSLLVILFAAAGCEKPDGTTTKSNGNNQDSIVVSTIFTMKNCRLINLLPDTVYIINSNEELANYINCENDLPQIDFSKQTLLVTCGRAPNGISNITSELTSNGGTYTLNIDILLEITAVAMGWEIALLTDKLTTNYIELNVLSHHQN
jgi:hypothetical protein